MKCPTTGLEIKCLAPYIKERSRKLNKSKAQTKFEIIEFTYGKNVICKENIEKLYLQDSFSLPDFKKLYGFSYAITLFLLDWFNIPKRSLKDAVNLDKKLEKCKQTCVAKYGVENVSQLTDVKEKKKDTFMEHYGVDNIRKYKPFYDWLDNYMLENFGTKRTGIAIDPPEKHSEKKKKWWASLPKEEKEKKVTSIVKNLHSKGGTSNLELKIAKSLDNLKIDYERHFYINRKQYDFYIKKFNLLIEVNGDFWHANPVNYKENDKLNFGKGKIVTAKELWEKDLKKKKLAESSGHSILYIWENEIKSNKNLDFLVFSKIEELFLNSLTAN